MASWAPAACMCWAMAQAMLRLLATPNTTTVRPSMLIGIRESSSASAIELIGSIFKDISLKVGCLGGVVPPYGDRILWMARDPALTCWGYDCDALRAGDCDDRGPSTPLPAVAALRMTERIRNWDRNWTDAAIFSFLSSAGGNILPHTTGVPLRRRRYGDDTRFADQSNHPLCSTRPDRVRGRRIHGLVQGWRGPRAGWHQPGWDIFRARHHEQGGDAAPRSGHDAHRRGDEHRDPSAGARVELRRRHGDDADARRAASAGV